MTKYDGPPRRVSADGPKIVVSSAANLQANSPSQGPAQAQIVRLVRPPRPRRLEVQISARLGRAPIGRTRTLQLSDHAVEQLVDFALQLEGRR